MYLVVEHSLLGKNEALDLMTAWEKMKENSMKLLVT
jgi:hypothetical protein